MRISLFPDLSLIQDEMNKIFTRFLNLSKKIENSGSKWSPLVDSYECSGKLFIKIEIPGVDREDIILEVRGDYLYIEGRRDQIKDPTFKGFLVVERNFGKFSRYIPINRPVDFASAIAKLKDGMLIVKFETLAQRKPEFCIKIEE